MKIQKQVTENKSEIEIMTTIKVDAKKYRQFRRTFDEQSWIDFVDYCVNSGHLDEGLGQHPGLRASFLELQSERLSGKKEA